MDFIDEQHVAVFEIGQKCRKIPGLGDHRAGCRPEIDTEFLGHDLRKRGLAQAGRTNEQHMIQRLAPVLCRLDEHFQIGTRLRLAGKLVQRLRPQRCIEVLAALFRCDQTCGIGHARSSIPGIFPAAFLSKVLIDTQPTSSDRQAIKASAKSALLLSTSLIA